MHLHPTPLHPIIIVGPFTKWGLDFMDYKPTSVRGNHHIIMAMDYFTNFIEPMPTVKYDGEIETFFVFNQIIAQFGILKEIFNDHGSHLQNDMITDLASGLGFKHDHLSS
jgi:hypothetical protein